MTKVTNGKEKNTVSSKSPRMANLELLRCVAMMMVVVLHYLGKGNLLADLTGAELGSVGTAAWIMEAFCIVAVNAYMLISGYFLSTSHFKLSRLIKLYLQLWFYSVGIGVLGIVTGIFPMEQVETHDLLTMIFPVFMDHYWFVSAYVFLYLFLPFIGGTVQRMSKKQLQVALGLLVLAFSLLKSVLPIRLELDGLGYDCIWYLCVFFTATYIRRFGCGIVKNLKRSVGLYVLACLAILGLTMGLRQVYLHTGSLGRIIKVAFEYNHILPYLAATGLFGVFLNIKVPEGVGRFINRIAPYTLGVYLLHENIAVRYAWQNWFYAESINSVVGLLLWTLVAVVVVFAAGILVDMLRELIMKILHVLFNKVGIYREAVMWVENVDKSFARDGQEI